MSTSCSLNIHEGFGAVEYAIEGAQAIEDNFPYIAVGVVVLGAFGFFAAKKISFQSTVADGERPTTEKTYIRVATQEEIPFAMAPLKNGAQKSHYSATAQELEL